MGLRAGFAHVTRGRKIGIYATGVIGLLLVAAASLQHLPLKMEPGPSWNGISSEISILGLIIVGLVMAATACFGLSNLAGE